MEQITFSLSLENAASHSMDLQLLFHSFGCLESASLEMERLHWIYSLLTRSGCSNKTEDILPLKPVQEATWNCTWISWAIDPQRSAAGGNATDSNLPFSPLQRHLSNSKIQGEHLSWYIVCLKEKHNKQDNWQRFTFSAGLKTVYSISWCLELQQSWFIILLHKKRIDTPSLTTDLWFRNIWSKDMKKFATSVRSKSISHNGTWQPIT